MSYLILVLFSFCCSQNLNSYKNNQSVDCVQLGTISASELYTNEIFDQGRLMGVMTAGILFGLPAHLYVNSFNEINTNEVDFKDYVLEQDCRKNYIESYKKENLRIRKNAYSKGVFCGTATLFGGLLIGFSLAATISN